MQLSKRITSGAGFLVQAALGLADEDAKRAVPHNRLILAARFIRGEGIEIGGLGRALPVPFGARVKYLDRFDREGLFANFPDLGRKKKIVEPDIIDNGETMETVPDASQDFLIANHVVEHLQNPILFFHNAMRVLKPGGILFMALPEKTKTFDRHRPVTTFEHLVEDYEKGPEHSKVEHFREYVRLADNHNGSPSWKTEAEYEAQVAELIATDYSIHFHVWDTPAMESLLHGLRTKYALPIETKALLVSGDEVVLILKKGGAKTT